jgi:SagB-type dehydrogenase family enzyme
VPGGSELWSLREDVHVEMPSGGGPLRLHSRWGVFTVQRPSPPVREALHRMRLGPVSLENVIGAPPGSAASPGEPADGGGDGAASGAAGGAGDPAQRRMHLHRVLDRLQPIVVRSLGMETGQPLLSVVPLTPRARFRPARLSPDVPVRLSVFAELRTDGTEYSLESPLSLHRVLLHRSEAIWLIGALGRAVTPAEFAAAIPFSDPATADALPYLAAAGMVVQAQATHHGQASSPPVFAEDTDPALAGWSPVDLMFHTRSTLGRHDHDFGATYPQGDTLSPEPVAKPSSTSQAVILHRPRWEELFVADPTLTAAIEGRHSVRSYGKEPVTAAELGELLYRTARIRSLIAPPSASQQTASQQTASQQTASQQTASQQTASQQTASQQTASQQTASQQTAPEAAELSDRPYPSGGACHELELYLTVRECAGISPGVYHYDPLGHRLEPVDADRAAGDELLLSACVAANMDSPPPVLITMTARFRRLSWKYEGLAYSLVLKHVGVLTQTLYLVSAAMRLAPCALGGLSVDAAARAFGVDWRIEPAVGGFAIGRDPGTPADHPAGWVPANDAPWADRARAHFRLRQNRPWASEQS